MKKLFFCLITGQKRLLAPCFSPLLQGWWSSAVPPADSVMSKRAPFFPNTAGPLHSAPLEDLMDMIFQTLSPSPPPSVIREIHVG